MSSLALGSAGQLGADQARVAGGLAEPQEGFEDLDLGAVQLGGVLAQQRIAVVCPQLVVAAPLLGLHVAVEGLLGLLGQVLDDLLLGAAEDERPQGLGQQDAVHLLERGAGPDVLLEDRVAAEHARVQELEDRPELAQVVLDRRAAHGQLVAAAQQPGGLGRLAVGVLDRLGLVEDRVVELEVGQLGDVGAHGAVGGDDQVVVGERLAEGVAAGAGVVEHAEPRGELGGLLRSS